MSALPLVWVVGSGGLLGASVWRELGADAWRPARTLSWGDPTRLEREFQDAVAEFGLHVRARPGRTWAVAWCAGAGVVGTSAAALERETRTFERFLALVASDPNLSALPGAFSLASSAGGVYAGSTVSPITEATEPAPISAYGHAKLAQERMLAAWVAEHVHVRALKARFSNLYGPGQQLAKAQGLISHTSRCVIYGAPVQIYVSLDTIRDYLFADDAARALVAGLHRLALSSDLQLVTKVYASEREVSIAGLLGVFRQIARRRLRVVAGLHATTSLQPRRLQFRSQVWNHTGRQVELIEGVSRVYQHQLGLFGRGLLPPPPPLASRR
ncbi:MAG: NAD-dependent epimerase/dehydratase family protein [Pseudomonadota bacterium]